MLGEALVQRCRALNYTAIPASRSSKAMPLDVTDRRQLGAALDDVRPDVVINSAAIASIDACELDPGAAYTVNAKPIADLAQLARTGRFKLVHISTDHFFSGGGQARHREDAPVTLVNEYARSKFAAEKFASLSPDVLIVRTAFVGRISGHNRGFAEQIYGLLQKREKIVLFEDTYTSLLHRSDAADMILRLIMREARGIINVASSDVFSKAALIKAFARKLELPLNGQSGSVTSLEIPRAESLGLDTTKVQGLLGCQMPTFEQTVDRLVNDFAG
jgi:dTDP-4-dehydrorhamnose reductase